MSTWLHYTSTKIIGDTRTGLQTAVGLEITARLCLFAPDRAEYIKLYTLLGVSLTHADGSLITSPTHKTSRMVIYLTVW